MMKTLWKRIEAWLEKNVPDILADLQPPANGTLITETEGKLGITLTDDLKQSYAIHNGQMGGAPLLGEWQLLSLDHVVKEWSLMNDLLKNGDFEGAKASASGPVKADWWNDKWIPIASNGAGDLYCADFDPAAKGVKGQIITFWHVTEERKVIAKSFKQLLEEFADDLEKNRYRVVDSLLEKSEK